jgi:hypothetical protein
MLLQESGVYKDRLVYTFIPLTGISLLSTLKCATAEAWKMAKRQAASKAAERRKPNS